VIQGDDGICTLGSTYGRNAPPPPPREIDTRRLLESLVSLLPDVSAEIIHTHVGIRATTRDRLPLVGRVPDWQALTRHNDLNNNDLNNNDLNNNDIFNRYQPGLYLSTGYGSHGATYSGLCGEHIANLICDEPRALTRPQQQILAIERFRLRDSRSKRNRNRVSRLV
jgi:glycine/D-amino acid oxidase-like deaminating enzyme